MELEFVKSKTKSGKSLFKDILYLKTNDSFFEELWKNPYPTIKYHWKRMEKFNNKDEIKEIISEHTYHNKNIKPLKFLLSQNLKVDYSNVHPIALSIINIYLKVNSKEQWYKIEYPYFTPLLDTGELVEVSSVLVYPSIYLQIFSINRDFDYFDKDYKYIYPMVVRYKKKYNDFKKFKLRGLVINEI